MLANTSSVTLLVYILTAILGILPLVFLLLSKRLSKTLANKNMKFWLAFFICISILGSLPLFWVAADYGRMIYIHIVCLTLLALVAIRENSGASQYQPTSKLFPWILSFLFIVSWRVIHFQASFVQAFPILVKIQGLFHYFF